MAHAIRTLVEAAVFPAPLGTNTWSTLTYWRDSKAMTLHGSDWLGQFPAGRYAYMHARTCTLSWLQPRLSAPLLTFTHSDMHAYTTMLLLQVFSAPD